MFARSAAVALGFAVLLAVTRRPASAAAAAAAPLTLRFRVEAPAGAALGAAGAAHVELLPAVQDYAAAKRRLAGQPAAVLSGAERAAADGWFTLQAPGPGCYRVTVRAEGYLPLETLVAPLLSRRELPPARLVPAVPFTVRAVGALGQPLAGVRLAVEQPPWSTTGDAHREPPVWRPAERSGTTGPDGRLVLPGAAGEQLTLVSLAPLYLGERLRLSVPEGAPASGSGKDAAHPEPFRLAEQPRLRLEIKSPAGQAVGGALLRLTGGPPLTLAGGDGRIEIAFADRVPDSVGALTVESPGGDLAAVVSWEQVREGVAQAPLAPLRRVVGELVDAATGKPAGPGLVWAGWFDQTWGPAAVATAAADGHFELRWLPEPGLSLAAASAGFLPARVLPPRNKAAPWRVALTRAVAMTGVVVDGAGRGVSGARVTAQPEEQATWPSAAATTDEAGRFTLPAVGAGARYRLGVAAAGFAPASVAATAPSAVPASPAVPVRIALDPGRAIVGRIVDPGGQPLAGVAVTVRDAADRIPRYLLPRSGEVDPREVRSVAGGAFELAHLSPGRYTLVASKPDWATTVQPELDLGAAGPRLDLGTIILEPGAVLAGSVIDSRGRPVAEARVSFAVARRNRGPGAILRSRAASRTASDAGMVSTGSDGLFRIPELRGGQLYDVFVETREHPPIAKQVRVPLEVPLRIELQDGARLRGRVIDGDRRPVFGAQVHRQPVAEDQFLAQLFAESSGGGFTVVAAASGGQDVTDAEGWFSLSGLAAGTVDLVVEAEGYRQVEMRDLPVSAEREAAPVEIVLQRGATLSGRIGDEAGNPLPGVSVLAMRPITGLASLRQSGKGTGMTDDDGLYRIGGLDEGPYEVRAFARGTEIRRIDIRPGENQLDFVLREPATTTVSGRVLDGAGSPLTAATLRLVGAEDGQIHAASSRADGAFQFTAVAPGSYQLSAVAPGYGTGIYPGSIGVADAPVQDLELTLQRALGAISGRIKGIGPEELAGLGVGAFALDTAASPAAAAEQQIAGSVAAAGTYRIAGLTAGRWNVVARSESGRMAMGQATLDSGSLEADLDLDFSGGVVLSGRVITDRGPVIGAVVAAGAEQMAGGTPMMGPAASGPPAGFDKTGLDGRFKLTNLQPGKLVLYVFDPYTLASVALDLELSGDQEIAIDLTTGGLKGRLVVATTGAPIARATVAVEPAATGRHPGIGLATATTDGSGVFELGGLVAGLYRVTASPAGYSPGEAIVEVAPHATTAVDLQLASAKP